MHKLVTCNDILFGKRSRGDRWFLSFPMHLLKNVIYYELRDRKLITVN